MKNKSKNKLNSQRAITLIALVVTIVVLLILAGVSLSLVLGNNGIINKAQQAKVETRAGSVDDEVNLWKTDNYLADNTNDSAETDEEMIARLRKNNLITADDEVDAENKTIKIKKKDGTVVREISYAYTSNKTTKNIFEYTQEGIITGIKEEFITDTNPDNPEQARINKSIKMATLDFKNSIKIAAAEAKYYLVKELNGSITIPEEIEGTKIVGIGDGAFVNIINLNNVRINAQIVNIGEGAFRGCEALLNINIPNSVKSIKELAFAYTGLTEITIPSSVETIEDSAFMDCENLTSVTIENGVKTIGESAFAGTALTKITIPSSVEAIGRNAFASTGLKQVTIPSSVTNMGSGVFVFCDGITVNVPFKEGEKPEGWADNWNDIGVGKNITINYQK